MFEILFQNYGPPDILISSPYLRARETAEIAQQIIYKLCGNIIPIIYNRYIGEYLGFQKDKNIAKELHEETLIHKPIPQESWNQYSSRIRRFTDNLEKYNKNTWYISHGLIIQSISLFLGSKINYPSELEGFILDNKNIIQI